MIIIELNKFSKLTHRVTTVIMILNIPSTLKYPLYKFAVIVIPQHCPGQTLNFQFFIISSVSYKLNHCSV